MLTVDQWLTIVTLIAIAVSPLIALEVQKWLENRRASLDRKMSIFRKANEYPSYRTCPRPCRSTECD